MVFISSQLQINCDNFYLCYFFANQIFDTRVMNEKINHQPSTITKLSDNSAFTLVELAIVMVIIGLIVGGVVGAQSLIRTSEINSIISDIKKYQTAVRAFKLEYGAIPGDMAEATNYWGVSTADGNGNKILGAGPEGYQVWQHMALAEIIPGSYTGITGPNQAIWDSELGVNVPASKIPGVGYTALSINYGNNNSLTRLDPNFTGSYQYSLNQIVIGKEDGDYWTNIGFLTPAEMRKIDRKIDNGLPGTGGIRPTRYNGCTDAGDAAASATNISLYDLSVTTEVCSITVMPRMNGLN